MNTDLRLRHALNNPYDDPRTQDVATFRALSAERDGNLLVSVLAVDR